MYKKVIHEIPKTINDIEAKRLIVLKQRKELLQQPLTLVTCVCGVKIPLKSAFRCWFCGITFCAKCAEIHYGKKPLLASEYLDKE